MRAAPQDMEFISPLKFGTELMYRTGDPREFIESENYFLGCKHLLNAGDEIRVACMLDDGTWEKARYEVAVRDEHAVVVQRIEDWRAGGMVAAPGLKAKHVGHGKWAMVDKHGKTVMRGLTKAQAESLETPEEKPQKAPKAQTEEQPADAA